MLLRVVITVLCGVGLYASLFMLGKTRKAELGLLEEPSVVQRPAARLYGGVPNALLGCVYYPALAIAVWLPLGHVFSFIVLSIVVFAAITSVVLAYSLLFITKRPCPYCWTAHAVNWLLLVMILLIQNEHIV